MTFDGKVVAITGGAGGIGLATARRLHQQGASVVVLDLDDVDVKRAVDDLTGVGPSERVLGLACDTAEEDAVRGVMDAARDRFGGLDGIVTAAGIRQTAATALDLPLDVWSRTLHVNVTGTFVAAREAARLMMSGGRPGSVVTIASVTGTSARMNQSAYCASKAAVIHLTKVLAIEWAQYAIRVNAVCPGVTKTPMIELAVKNEGPQVLDDKLNGSMEQFRPGIPLRRLATPEEQAAAICFLLSDDTSFVTGVALGVDGGAGVV